MRDICDLHTHSTFSDGTCTPRQLVGLAIGAGLGAAALTDHNTVAGLAEFMDAAKNTPLEAIAGVEISTGFRGTEIHIVGLFIRPESFAQITDFLSVMIRRKEESNLRLTEALARNGYELDYREIKARHKGSVNRAVIAAELVKKGYAGSVGEAIKGLLSEERGYYIPPERIASLDAIAFLKDIGAAPVLAHPFVSMKDAELPAFLSEAKDAGLAAIETRYSTYSPETAARASELARRFGLLESGGSDFHGENKPDIKLGTGRGDLAVPMAFARKIKASLA